MHINVLESEGVTVIVLEGRIDSSTASDVGQTLSESLEGGATRLVIDLDAVEYVNTAGLREFIAALKKARQRDGDLRLASPRERVREVLALSGLDTVFAVHDTRGEAVSSY